MKKSTKRSRRHRNPQPKEEGKTPFFTKVNKVKTKTDTPFFQSKLKVGQANDPYEKEADAVADKVVNNNSETPVVQQKQFNSIQRYMTNSKEDEKGTNTQRIEHDKEIQEKPEVQKQEESVQMQEEEESVQMMEEEESVQMQEEEESVQMMEEEEGVQMQEEEESVQMMEEEEGVQMQEEEESVQMQEEEEAIQAKGNPSSRNASSQLTNKLSQSKGKGKPMSPNVRTEMESGFGVDFSKVRIHTDKDAVSMNKNLHAQAFANGKDLYFNKGKYNPESTAGKTLLAHELTHVIQQTGGKQKGKTNNHFSDIQREMEIDPVTNRPTGNYLFRIGTNLSSGFMSRLKRFIATGVLTDDQLNKLRVYSLTTRGSVTHAERLIMAAALDPVNIPLIRAHRRGVLSIQINNISSANRDKVSNIGREELPENITRLLIQANRSLMAFDLNQFIEFITQINDATVEKIYEIGGKQFSNSAIDLVIFAQEKGLFLVDVLQAMLNGASDNSRGDQVMAGIVYATAKEAGHTTAEQIKGGTLKIDALIPRAFNRLQSAHGADAFYSAAGRKDKLKGDTVYVPTNMDIFHVAHRALIIHELTHASDDAAASGINIVPAIDGEIKAYQRQTKYVMDQLLAAPDAEQATVINQASGMVGLDFFQWGFLIATKRDSTRYEEACKLLLETAPGTSRSDVDTALTTSEADMLTNLRQAILRLPAYSSGGQAVEDGQSGESVLDHIN